MVLIGIPHKNCIDEQDHCRSRKNDNQGKDSVHHHIFEINDIPYSQDGDNGKKQYTGYQNVGDNFLHGIHSSIV
jgi:hypothetical protein